MKPKQLIIELAIIVTIVTATWLTIKESASETLLDIQLHDTYFVIDRSTIILPVSLLLITLIYLVKEGFAGYKRRFQNLILVTADFLSLVWLYPLSVFINSLPQPGWTIYPPLSALPNAVPRVDDQAGGYPLIINGIKHFIPIVLIVFMLILVASSFLTGKNWNAKPHEQNIN
jgi:heme/copper-type cytochrome/quinol oxidase subunit 1